ncbi:major capsid protein [Secundilactobacillus oryzae]|uniref:major capsid protein n=1 Tax=Secundilactobacillus oryzae TaxID=1202668 RepID=UPI0006D29D15|nr:minor capsid protein E [Secundilactobacillus oryzae]
MRTLADIENPNAIIGYWNQRANERQPYLYQSLFSTVYNSTDEVELIYGENEPARMLTATTDDVKAVKLNNIGFESDKFGLIPFKNYKGMDEKRRSDIKNALANNASQAQVEAITNTQYQDPATLLTDATFTREVLSMQALTTGKISVTSGNLLYKRDFGLPAEHKVEVSTEWGNMDSAPLADIQEQIDKINDDNGTVIAHALMNGRTFRKLLSLEK